MQNQNNTKKVFALAKFNGNRYKLILNLDENCTELKDYDQHQLKGKLVHLESNFLKYEGDFLRRKFHGKGIYHINQTDYFNGTFENGQKVQGILVKNGCTYIGKLVNDKPQGYGQLQFSDGSSYFGGFQNGQLSGTGEYKKIVNGTPFISRGQWVNGRREGLFSIENVENQKKIDIIYRNGFILEINNVMGSIKDFGFENEIFLKAIKFAKILPSFNLEELENEELYFSQDQKYNNNINNNDNTIVYCGLTNRCDLDNKNQQIKNQNNKVLLKKKIAKGLYKIKQQGKQQQKNQKKDQKQSQIPDSDLPSCSICLEEIQKNQSAKIFPCKGKHIFHQTCIDLWLDSKFTCPDCRHDLTQIGIENLVGDGKNIYLNYELLENEQFLINQQSQQQSLVSIDEELSEITNQEINEQSNFGIEQQYNLQQQKEDIQECLYMGKTNTLTNIIQQRSLKQGQKN